MTVELRAKNSQKLRKSEKRLRNVAFISKEQTQTDMTICHI